MVEQLSSWKPGWSLPQPAYTDPDLFSLDLDRVWFRDWILAGVEAAIPAVGDFERVSIGPADVLVIRADDGSIRALHNVCRHRGSQLCEQQSGRLRKRIVCPYHQWTYDLDGRLLSSRSMAPDFNADAFALGQVHCRRLAGLIFVCLAETPPPFDAFADLVGPYLAPYRLENAVVAHRTTAVEHGNWKLVMENNRECYHCSASHPELMHSFPAAPLHSATASVEETAQMETLVAECEAIGLPSRYQASADNQYRVMRMPFNEGVTSMTRSGAAAVRKRFAGLPDRNIGDVLLYHYPSSWNHFQADHSLVFRVTPLSPTSTQLTSYWLVPEGSVAGIDYDVATLTEVWEATNRQDTALVERAQRGVASPAYRPGPYSPTEESGVVEFVQWYMSKMS